MAREKRKANIGKKMLSFILVLALLVGAGVVGYFLFMGNQEAQTVMEMSVNPEVQFVLNNKDRVIAVNYLNSDAEVLLKEVNFTGKKADDAAKLFVQLSTEAGYIDVETTGTTIEIDFRGKTDVDMDALKNDVINKVNSYFDEKGIIAGASAMLRTNIKAAVEHLGVNASRLVDLTEDEVMALLTQTSKDLEGIALSVKTTILNTYNSAITELDGYMEQLAGYMEVVNDSNATQTQKLIAQGLYDTLKLTYDAAKEVLESVIENAKELSIEIYNTAKATLEAAIIENKNALEEHVKASQSTIDAYRDTIGVYI